MFRTKYTTNIPIEKFFWKPITLDSTEVTVLVKLDPPAVNTYGVKTSKVVVRCKGETMNILPYQGEPTTYTWTPKSHMRDFEVVVTDGEEDMVARGQGIGAIVLEPLDVYLRLKYDRDAPCGISPSCYHIWRHDRECQNLLANNLSLGYHVLLYDGKTFHSLLEERDSRDEQETKIFFSSMKDLARYQHDS